jgi:pseudaminic acid cytidylyltransferase
MFFPQYYKYRSQDLKEAYHDAGQFYWAATDTWLENKPIISKNSSPLLIPRYRAMDIDTIEDWFIAEKMFMSIYKKKK